MTGQQEAVEFPFPAGDSLFHPVPELARVQRDRPVAPFRGPDGRSGWLVTRFADVRQVLVDPRFSRAQALGPDVPDLGLAPTSGGILSMDPPGHTRLRRLVAGAFTARRVEALRPRVAHIVGELIDGLEAAGSPADLVERFSLPLPVRVICELLGVPAEDQPLFHSCSERMLGLSTGDPQSAPAALAELTAYLATLISLKRAEPADDLMTALIQARDDRDRLSENELVRLCATLLVAGHETTANQINMMLLTLHEHPDQLELLRKQPDRLPQAVEELSRFVQLGSAGAAMPRVATEEVRLGDVVLPPGAAVFPMIAVANRDPGLTADPDRLDLTREAAPHLAFGAGVHHCLGAQLARLELQEALRGLLTRLPDLRIDTPVDELRFKDGMIVRSLHHLAVRW